MIGKLFCTFIAICIPKLSIGIFGQNFATLVTSTKAFLLGGKKWTLCPYMMREKGFEVPTFRQRDCSM
jgi:hypothetical protein